MAKSVLPIRVDDETKARWQAAADDAGYKLSEFIRASVNAQIDGPAPVSAGTRARRETLGGLDTPSVPGQKRSYQPDLKPVKKPKPTRK